MCHGLIFLVLPIRLRLTSPFLPFSVAAQVSQNHTNITDNSSGPDVEKIVSQLEGNLTAETLAPSFAKTMLDSVSFLLDKPQSQVSPMSKRYGVCIFRNL